MNKFLIFGIGLVLFMSSACNQVKQQSPTSEDVAGSVKEKTETLQSNEVINTIMARRSIRKYKSQPIEQEKLQSVLECGINAPNGMYKQSWEIRVVTSEKVMSEIEKGYTAYLTKNGRKRISHPSFGAPCLIFIAHDTAYDLSQVDCGLLGGNMILAAQSMGLGTCCLGGIVRYMNSPEASDLLKRLNLPESYNLLYALAIGYPDEAPAAKPRNKDKIKFVE